MACGLKKLCGAFSDGIKELIVWKKVNKFLQLFSELYTIHAGHGANREALARSDG